MPGKNRWLLSLFMIYDFKKELFMSLSQISQERYGEVFKQLKKYKEATEDASVDTGKTRLRSYK